jgi:hypothetical protein
MPEIPFPDNCLRGIPNEQFVLDEETVAPVLFFFHKRDARDGGWTEQSINWEDDEEALAFTLNQTKEDGERQFRAGVAVIARRAIDGLSMRPAVAGVLRYERQPLVGNAYHGNLLLRTSVSTRKMKMIAAGLALYARRVGHDRG